MYFRVAKFPHRNDQMRHNTAATHASALPAFTGFRLLLGDAVLGRFKCSRCSWPSSFLNDSTAFLIFFACRSYSPGFQCVLMPLSIVTHPGGHLVWLVIARPNAAQQTALLDFLPLESLKLAGNAMPLCTFDRTATSGGYVQSALSAMDHRF
jgi:hypothetical protein